MTTPRTSRLTPAMWRVVFGVGAVIVAGAIVTIWLLVSSGAPLGTGPGSGSSGGPSAGQTVGPLPDATPTSGSEVITPTEPPNQTLPPIEPAKPLVAPPFPVSGTSEGGLVDGFPDAVMSPMPDSDVLQSSIATEGGVMQVSLVGRTDAAEPDVRAYYAALWSSLGLQEQGPSTDGSLSYTGAHESLTLAFTTSGTGTRYTLFGVFRAG